MGARGDDADATAEADRGVTERVMDVIAVTLEAERSQLRLDTRIRDDLKADSLDLLSLVMALEDEFSGSIAREATEQLLTIGDVVACIEQMQQAGRSADAT